MIGRYAQQGALGNWAYIDPSIADHFVIAVYENDDLTGAVVRIPNSQAPAIALAILKAAGFVPGGNRRDSDSFQESVDVAAGYLDDAVLIAAGTAAREELNQRRDELAKHLIPVADATYALALPAIKTAIDMIIQLQDEVAK